MLISKAISKQRRPARSSRSRRSVRNHGRIEVRTYTVAHVVDWYAPQRTYPGAPRFPQLTTIAMVESRIERGDKIESEQRSYISSRALSAAASRTLHEAIGASKTTFTGPST